ncbi:MAG: hypothetical protein RL417_635, partial [Pseudomonadota bacterium]
TEIVDFISVFPLLGNIENYLKIVPGL